MGLVKKEEKKGAGEESNKEAPPPPEDPPIVKQLKELDDKYLELEKEYEREVQKLLLAYTAKQQPLLDERKKVLAAASPGEGATTGTPALKGFWLQAMKNHPAFEEAIQEWDEPVLEYLADIEKAHMDETDANKGFRLTFRFVENPYFKNTELVKEYRTEVANPYCGEIEVKEVKSTKIEWKAGKDVTVEKVSKKVKGGGAKKAKQKNKEKEEPRPSLFRDFFRNLQPDMKLAEEEKEHARMLAADDEEEEDDEDDEALVAYLMESDHETGTALRDHIIPFAIRWYTGEAAPDDDDDDEGEDSEDDEEDDDDDEDDDDEDDEPPRGRGKPKAKPKKGGDKSKATPELKPADGPPKEECKQQ